MARGLVSVVTPTWRRPDDLLGLVSNLALQTYRSLEHVVVSDGPDEDAADLLGHAATLTDVPITVTELGRNWSGLMPESFGIAPLTVGYLMARGEYLMPWCDDERALTSDHVSRLVDLLESSGADFVYPRVRIWRNGDPGGPETTVIGTDPPAYCQITHYLFRAELLTRAMPAWGSHPVDWSLVESWMRAGARWAMLDDCTFSHRLDQ